MTIPTTWQQLAGLSKHFLRESASEVEPERHSISVPSQDMLPQVTPTTQLDTAPSQGPNQAPNLFAGVSSRVRVCRMTQAMADSIEQQDLFSQPGRGPTAFEVTFDEDLEESDDDQEYTKHLDIQDRMRNQVAF